MKKISVVIPVYNENENVNLIYQKVIDVFDKNLSDFQLEIVFSDNQSLDDTYDRIKKLNEIDQRVKGIQLSRNFGYQANILTGYLNATGDAVIQMDSDGEDPPEIILDFIKRWEEGFDVVYGIRIKRQESIIIQWQRKIFYSLLNKIASLNLPPGAGDFRLLDRKVVNVLCEKFQERNPYLRGLTSFIGFRQTGVPYERDKRQKGTSKFSYFSYFRLAWDAITSFSRVPLKFVSFLGFCMSIIAIIAAVFYFFLFLSGKVEAKGFTTLILVILFLSGTQLLCLGILGEYIDRIFDEVKARPRSIVAHSCGLEKEPRNA